MWFLHAAAFMETEQSIMDAMKRQVVNRFGKTGIDLAQAYNDMPTGSGISKSIQVALCLSCFAGTAQTLHMLHFAPATSIIKMNRCIILCLYCL